MSSKIPWESVKMLTLRSLCQEIGAPHWGAMRKDEMIAFLQAANEKGVEAAAKEMPTPANIETRADGTSVKRKAAPKEEPSVLVGGSETPSASTRSKRAKAVIQTRSSSTKAAKAKAEKDAANGVGRKPAPRKKKRPAKKVEKTSISDDEDAEGEDVEPSDAEADAEGEPSQEAPNDDAMQEDVPPPSASAETNDATATDDDVAGSGVVQDASPPEPVTVVETTATEMVVDPAGTFTASETTQVVVLTNEDATYAVAAEGTSTTPAA
ncbi:hypothetical protein PUNSTDRAFT_122791 [Punctularia strigosozonata HHB-11173 SS5]|uniref:Uncharacterized protein n=1 Tax=Punctularia strigosozonata (strain HHB-11173) TaxID=741275 RepID=R7S3Q5_PUNST|nr:uncharacterized protein PUNSTDRAFT_122791 [Punctularia strigosozonata HHB-11173 SS5]EIN04432.1 hypothetical protein PUNSTDRAFT_122791 [Punctularia strigosozonata HHB-11173 SS5]